MDSSDEVGASRDRVSKLVKLLAEDRQWTSIEIAEVLWLALRIEPAVEVIPEEKDECRKENEDLDVVTRDEISDSEILDNSPLTPLPPPRANITTSAPKVGVLPPQALPIRVADPAMLTDPLAIIRALKPLLRQVSTGSGRRLDEFATVEYIARTRLWLPIVEPEREPWFDIILVVDRSSSMHIWDRLVTDLVAILRRYGAFRDLQVYNLDVDPGAAKSDRVLLRSRPDRPGHRPSELIDQRGQRLAIILSDCAGSYWWDGTLLPPLQDWAKAMPTVVWQMLPEWMWERTALGRGQSVALSNDIPGATNQQLIVQRLEREEQEINTAQQLPIPVVTSEVRDLANWSLMLAGDRREVTPGFLLPQKGGSIPRSKGIEDIARDRVERNLEIAGSDALEAAFKAELDAIARRRVERFRELSSPPARRLVMLLAAAPVITLPVMRLIRDSMLYEAKSPLPIAEVFLSGLLQRLPGQEDIDPEQVQYDFVPQAREVLLEVLPAVDTIDVINSVSAAVEKRWNQFSNQDFRAFLTNPNIQAPEGLEGLKSFASVTATILEKLGGEYASFARQLRQGTGEEPPEPTVEAANFPELQLLQFIDAQIVDEREPSLPLLQVTEFLVATVSPSSSNGSFSEEGRGKNSNILVMAIHGGNLHPGTTEIAEAVAGYTHSFYSFKGSDQSQLVPSTEFGEVIAWNLVQNAEIVLSIHGCSGDEAFLRIGGLDILHRDQMIASCRDSGFVVAEDDTAGTNPLDICNLGRRMQGIQVEVSWGLRDQIFSPSREVRDQEKFERLVQALQLGLQDRAVFTALEPFEFVVATIEREEGRLFRRNPRWKIQRRRTRSQRLEQLMDLMAVGLEMVAIPGGSFLMGSPDDEPVRSNNEGPQHKVTVQSFFIGRYPVTQAQWYFVAGLPQVARKLELDPSNFEGGDLPVEKVSWYDAVEFCARLSQNNVRKYRLPTEAEWEYACRAGTTTPFHFGQTMTSDLANYDASEVYNNGLKGEGRQKTNPIDQFDVANAFGLSDMHGSVWEWCQDHWHGNYKRAPTDGSAWLSEEDSANRVVRGGSWLNAPKDCRSAARNSYPPDYAYSNIGFRVVCIVPIAP